jgi:hypothetical protein
MYGGKPVDRPFSTQVEAPPTRTIHSLQIRDVQTRCQKIWRLMDAFPSTARPVKDEVLGILEIMGDVER